MEFSIFGHEKSIRMVMESLYDCCCVVYLLQEPYCPEVAGNSENGLIIIINRFV